MTSTALLVGIVAALAGLAVGYAVARVASARTHATLTAQLAAGEATRTAEQAAAAEKIELMRQSTLELSERFRALSADALAANNQAFLELADTRLKEAGTRASSDLDARRQAVERLVQPLSETLDRVRTRLEDLDRDRVRTQAALSEQLGSVRQTSEALRTQTAALVTALRKPQTRGQWGEMQLRRTVEVAGMVEHCDFETQPSVPGVDGVQRPDLVVHLAGGKNVVVDSKVPLAAFLEAAEARDDEAREERLLAHVRQLRTHVDLLAGKAYWTRLTPAPEFVVMFLPGEAILSQALETDPTLIEYAATRHVMLATPTTLIALLRTVAYAWTQEALADNAREVFELGRELYGRLGTLGAHVDKLGRALTTAVGAFNNTVGSLESRVLVTARRLSDLHIVEAELDSPAQVELVPRVVSAEELLPSGPGAEIVDLPA
jgi:DNA recombination protein RmuC